MRRLLQFARWRNSRGNWVNFDTRAWVWLLNRYMQQSSELLQITSMLFGVGPRKNCQKISGHEEHYLRFCQKTKAHSAAMFYYGTTPATYPIGYSGIDKKPLLQTSNIEFQNCLGNLWPTISMGDEMKGGVHSKHIRSPEIKLVPQSQENLGYGPAYLNDSRLSFSFSKIKMVQEKLES